MLVWLHLVQLWAVSDVAFKKVFFERERVRVGRSKGKES